MGLFDFFDMASNHEEREVARFEKDKLTVDTCLVTDADQPYETVIEHPSYNNGKWVIVELYDTEKEAKKGHDKWVRIMTAEELPLSLRDVSSATIAKLRDDLVGDSSRRIDKKDKIDEPEE